MKISLVQYNPEWENPAENIKKVNSLLENLPETDVVILPELTLTGFTMASDKYGEEEDGISSKYFISLASRLRKHIFAGLIERDGDKFYNNLMHFDKNGLITARYRKIHPFSFADEDKFYSAGKDLIITKIDNVRIGLTICYDLRFPELYRKYAKEGIDILINIANWPTKRVIHWSTLLKARAIENQCYMVGVNRCGTDPFNEYSGHSGVYDPLGEELVTIVNEEAVKTVEIHIEKVKEIREKLPFLSDMKLI